MMKRHFNTKTIRIATIPISVIVMFAFISACWDSLDRLKTANYVLGWTLAIAAVAAFVISNRVETIEGEHQSQRDLVEEQRRLESERQIADANKTGALANQEAGRANERAALLEKEAAIARLALATVKGESARVLEQVGSRAVRLTQQKRQELTAKLTALPEKVPLLIMLAASDRDTQEFAMLLMPCFGNWDLEEDGFMHPVQHDVPVTGIRLESSGGRTLEVALAINAVLKEVGLGPIAMGRHPTVPPGMIRIVVGAKPVALSVSEEMPLVVPQD